MTTPPTARPTVGQRLGRIPHATSPPFDFPIGIQLMDVEGPMARRVADLQAAFEVLAGPGWRGPWTVPAPHRGPRPATPVRVALVSDPAGQGIAEQVREGVRKAGLALAAPPSPVRDRMARWGLPVACWASGSRSRW